MYCYDYDLKVLKFILSILNMIYVSFYLIILFKYYRLNCIFNFFFCFGSSILKIAILIFLSFKLDFDPFFI